MMKVMMNDLCRGHGQAMVARDSGCCTAPLQGLQSSTSRSTSVAVNKLHDEFHTLDMVNDWQRPEGYGPSAKLPVIVVGAGPVGMVAAADLVRQNIPVLVLEKRDSLGSESRASTFHPPTLDMLEDLGFASALIAQGLKAPTVQYSSSEDGVLGTFDFATISDLVRHPFPLQAEQFKLTRIILDRSEEHTSELQSPDHLVCRLLLEKKKKNKNTNAQLRTHRLFGETKQQPSYPK